MRRSLLVLLIVIQILALFILENMFTLFTSLEKNEVAAVVALSDLQAELHVQKTLRRLPRPGREKFFDRIVSLPAPESGRQLSISGRTRLLQIKKPLGANSGLLFVKTIRSPQLDRFAQLKKVLSGLIFFLAITIAVCGVALVVRLRKKGPEASAGAGSPLQDYLAEIEHTQLALQDLVAEQNRSTFQKEELNKSIINTVHLGVILVDAGGKIAIFNPAAQELFKRSFASAKNNSLDVVLSDHPGLASFIQSCEKKSSAEIESGSFIFFVDVVPVGAQSSPPAVATGRLALIRDVSAERKREKVERQNANLMMLGEMAAALAHEIRNSLGVILGYSKAMRSEPEKTRKVVREISFLSEMMESFLQFARPVEKISRRKVDAGKAIAAAAAAQEMQVDLPQGSLQLKSDPLLLNVIFSNLALNARQAGAGRLKVEFRAGESPALTIADDGPGIAAENRDKVWLPFFSTRDKGTGMGLATVKKLVSALNGDIQLLNPGEPGARFRIVFYT